MAMAEAGSLPIHRLTLYKHGVGFVQRRGRITGEELHLALRADELNDVLKSLLIIDHADGQILGMHYDTPADRQARLDDCSIKLADDHSLLDLLSSLRGCAVRLVSGDGSQRREHTGVLVGVEVVRDQAPLADLLVSLLDETTGTVAVLPLAGLQQVYLQEERSVRDLRLFLDR